MIPWDKTPTGMWTDRWIDDSMGQDRSTGRQMNGLMHGQTQTDRSMGKQTDQNTYIYKNDINRYFLQSAVVSLTRVKLTVLYNDSH